METLSAYVLLFFSAFVAATIVPAQSEAVLLGLLLSNSHPAWALLLVASTGNVLGSCINWQLGRHITRFENKNWFPAKGEQLARARDWYHRYGRWSLLLSWVPVIGDPLTVAAGVMREPFAFFVSVVAIAKTSRYLAIWYFSQSLIQGRVFH